MHCMDSLAYKTPTCEHVSDLVPLMEEFLKHEPELFKPLEHLKLYDRKENIQKYLRLLIEDNEPLHMMAWDAAANKPVGLLLNVLHTPESMAQWDYKSLLYVLLEGKGLDGNENKCPQNMVQKLTKKIDLFSAEGVDRAMEMKILSVLSSHRGQGVAYQLMAKSAELCKVKHIPLILTVATNPITGHIATKLGLAQHQEPSTQGYLYTKLFNGGVS